VKFLVTDCLTFKRYIDHVQFAAYEYIAFFFYHILSCSFVSMFVIIVYKVLCFVCFYLIL